MMMVFVLVAGSLAAGAALLLLLPLLRRREDARPASAVTSVVVMSVMLLGAAGIYALQSNYTWTEQMEVSDTPAAMTARLAKRLAQQPEDLEGWLMLGRSYAQLEQFPLAIRAYQRADRLAGGKSVEALLGVGELLVAEDPEAIRGSAGHLFERALELDPSSQKALFYSAFGAMSRGELAVSRERFARMLTQNPPEQVRVILERQIANLDRVAAEQGKSPAAAAAGAGPKITVRVSLSPQLARELGTKLAEVPLFVAARDPAQPGPPFAVKRLAATFPQDVELTTADAMMESRRIAADQKLEVVARLALGGSPTATSGDPFGQVGYHVGRDGKLEIVIDRRAP